MGIDKEVMKKRVGEKAKRKKKAWEYIEKIWMGRVPSVDLTLSTPAVPNCCCLKDAMPYWSNPPVLIFDIWALWRSVLSARAPKCQQEALLLQRNRATRYISWNIMAVI